jgi:hypothetical protein
MTWEYLWTINHDMGIPVDSRREVLMGYQYALHQHKRSYGKKRVS